jgi:hypothetical protein
LGGLDFVVKLRFVRPLNFGNALLIPGAYAPLNQKNKFQNIKKIRKIRKKYSHVYIHILCAHAQFREKQIFLLAMQKKDTKKMCRERLILVPNFIIFT